MYVAMYVEDVKDVKDGKRTYTSFEKLRLRTFQPYHQILCILKLVKDRSNTHKGCNAMYVEDVEDGKRTYTHIFAHNFLNIQPIFNLQKVLRS